jgi:hypothetical protein
LFAGYSMKYEQTSGGGRKFRVRLDNETELQIRHRLLWCATDIRYRDSERLECEFRRRTIPIHRGGELRTLELLYYEPVRSQFKAIVNLVNTARRKKGLPPVSANCIPNRRTPLRATVDARRENMEAA